MLEKIEVRFYGKYIPLQGVEYIIRAAALLKDDVHIHFTLLGSGQTYAAVRRLADELRVSNVTFTEKVPYEEIPHFVGGADIFLGIFGDTEKTSRVIPNKVFDGAAMGKAVITADTLAIREVFTDKGDIYLCEVANPHALAEAIRYLSANAELRGELGEAARSTYLEKATPTRIGHDFLREVEPLVR